MRQERNRNQPRRLIIAVTLVITLGAYGCASNPPAESQAPIYENVHSMGKVAGVGIESQDIVSMTTKMMFELLQVEKQHV